jgi:hypothetical protein
VSCLASGRRLLHDCRYVHPQGQTLKRPSNAPATGNQGQKPAPAEAHAPSRWHRISTKVGTIAKRRLESRFSNRRIYLDVKGEWVGASGFEPPASWSRIRRCTIATWNYYQAGHMMYIDSDSRAKLK